MADTQALKQLVIKPTIYCYHKCPYCDLRQDYYKDVLQSNKQSVRLLKKSDAKSLNAGHMPLDMALRMIDQAAALGMESLQLSGGDPLLYPHLRELIEAGARHPGVFVFMNSVGSHVTVEKAKALISAGLGAWNFSIDSLDPVKYDQLRGMRGALPKIMQAIEVVREAARDNPDFCINYMTVVTRHNFRDLPALVTHCLENRIASIYLMNVYGDATGESLLNEQEIVEFRDRIVPEVLSIVHASDVEDVVKANAVEVMKSFFSRENSDANYAKGIYWASAEDAKQACKTPDFYALIEPNGKVLPCCLVEISHEGEVGDVTDSDLGEVWTGDGYKTFREKRIDFCRKCSSPRHKTLGFIPKLCRQFNV